MPDVAAAGMNPGAAAAGAPLLAVRGLNAWYGESHILHGVDFDVAAERWSRCSAVMAPARRPR